MKKNTLLVLILISISLPSFASSDQLINPIDNEKVQIDEPIQDTHHDSNNITDNGLDTLIYLNNKGGYVASMGVAYSVSIGGAVHHYQVRSDTVSSFRRTRKIVIPANAYNVTVTGQLATGLVWDRMRTIFNENVCTYNNQWRDSNNNIIQFDVWGTTLNSPWSMVKVNDSWSNGSQSAYKCSEI